MKLFVEIPNEQNLYLGVIKWKEQTFANKHLEKLWEKIQKQHFYIFHTRRFYTRRF